MKVGDGRDTFLFYDLWLGEKRLVDNDELHHHISLWGRFLKLSQWWDDGWKIPISFERRFGSLVENITQIQLTDSPDKIIWKGTASGTFSISSAYDIVRRKGTRVQWNKYVWHGNSTPRWAFISWLLMHNRLKTREALQSRNFNINGGCLFCNHPFENASHVFFKCSFTAAIWTNLLLKVGIRRTPQHWRTEFNWFKKKVAGRIQKARLLRGLLSSCVYYIWTERNEKLFNHRALSKEELCNKIFDYAILLA